MHAVGPGNKHMYKGSIYQVNMSYCTHKHVLHTFVEIDQ